MSPNALNVANHSCLGQKSGGSTESVVSRSRLAVLTVANDAAQSATPTSYGIMMRTPLIVTILMLQGTMVDQMEDNDQK